IHRDRSTDRSAVSRITNFADALRVREIPESALSMRRTNKRKNIFTHRIPSASRAERSSFRVLTTCEYQREHGDTQFLAAFTKKARLGTVLRRIPGKSCATRWTRRKIRRTSLCWTDGFAGWKPLSSARPPSLHVSPSDRLLFQRHQAKPICFLLGM